jgi:hypothetical protein
MTSAASRPLECQRNYIFFQLYAAEILDVNLKVLPLQPANHLHTREIKFVQSYAAEIFILS